MSLLRAVVYFLVEASSGLWRGWKASLLAILTIGVSLFVWSAFLLAGQNLSRTLERWRGEARLIVYLDADTSSEEGSLLQQRIADAPWVAEVSAVTAGEAQERFREAFPSLDDLLEGWVESPLPASLEVKLDADAPREQVGAWMGDLAADPAVEMVDDDRDWIDRLEAIATMAQTVGLVVGLVLLGAATFTIASVVRLNAYMYQDEISIMRLVGATEFLIRGPFYFEGLLQGLFGGFLAYGALYLVHSGLLTALAADGVLVDLLVRDFLHWSRAVLLVAIGAAAGLIGAVISLKGEVLSLDEA